MSDKLYILLQNIKNGFESILGSNLTGIYIHGSVAFDCFNWKCSDVDFIVVVESQPTMDKKIKIIQLLLELDKMSPAKGLEVSIVLKQHCTGFVYPTPYCLHFSNYHKPEYLKNTVEHLNRLQGTDKDLAAHFTVINHCGITLCGADKDVLFATVPREDYIDSIIFDIENAAEEIAENPVYMTLNLCRVLAFVKDGKVLSKADGGKWGVYNLPQYKDIIEYATDCYTNDHQDNSFDKYNLVPMAEDIMKEIYKNI